MQSCRIQYDVVVFKGFIVTYLYKIRSECVFGCYPKDQSLCSINVNTKIEKLHNRRNSGTLPPNVLTEYFRNLSFVVYSEGKCRVTGFDQYTGTD